ncbi:hypothetical protein C5B91_19305 [Haloferax sp. Atlit-10N]|uniref:M28 family metallopeptidase n=1 Tax=unclassified Haloferax TaxID=2625095 RepID=UPI000E241E42|nr:MULTISPECIES: M28 family peptidase [unclassified Haloferax]RDZ39581.1 hypothetical protein C5B87_19010 [Haloferax sp. Atlit-16N]RDZ55972.1 hypothetical protein C5B91_19305 [Haloferax sp. Atlit-10N]
MRSYSTRGGISAYCSRARKPASTRSSRRFYGSYYWSHTHGLENVKCIVNVDGAGYSRDLEIYTHGFDAIGEAFEEVEDEYEIPITIVDGLRPHSDHWPFVQQGVAGVQGRSSATESCRGWGHTHGDTLDKLDIRDLRDLSILCAAGIGKLAEADRDIPHVNDEDIKQTCIDQRFDVGMKATQMWP